MVKNKINYFKSVVKLISFIGNFSYIILIAVINGSLGNLIAIFIPVLGALAIAKGLGATVMMSYGLIFSLIVVFGVLRGVVRYFEQYFNHYIAFKLLAKFRNKIYQKLCVLSPAKLEDKNKGQIIAMITADIETIEIFYAHTLSPLGIALTTSLSMFLFIGFAVNWYMACFALFAYTLIGVILPIIYSKFLFKPGYEYRSNFGKFNGLFMNQLNGHRETVLYDNEEKAVNKINSKTDELLEKSDKLKRTTLITQIISVSVVILMNVLMLVIGIHLVQIGVLNKIWLIVGLVALMSSYGPILSLAALPSFLNQTFASCDRLFKLLDEEPKVLDIKNGKNIEFDSLEVKDLTFSYADNQKVIENLNFSVKVNEVVGIKGVSGSGKSTFLKLLLRFWERDNGDILYNGESIDNINTSSLKDNVVMVSQYTYIFNDTIKNNLKIAKMDATDEEIIQACKNANIYELILGLKDGYETVVGENNRKLSAGESQRIGLARAFLSNARLILLDEPTSNVDAINEGIILSSLIKNKSKKAIILISHRDSALSITDKVYCFKDLKKI